MREGFYKVDYQGAAGLGFAVLALDTGMVIGADVAGGIYDGEYAWNEQAQRLDVEVTIKAPEGTLLVQGVVAPAGGLEFKARCSFPREPENQIVHADTDYGMVAVRISLLRSFA